MWSKARSKSASRPGTYFFRKWGRGGRGPGASPGVPGPPPGLPRRLAAQNGKGELCTALTGWRRRRTGAGAGAPCLCLVVCLLVPCFWLLAPGSWLLAPGLLYWPLACGLRWFVACVAGPNGWWFLVLPPPPPPPPPSAPPPPVATSHQPPTRQRLRPGVWLGLGVCGLPLASHSHVLASCSCLLPLACCLLCLCLAPPPHPHKSMSKPCAMRPQCTVLQALGYGLLPWSPPSPPHLPALLHPPHPAASTSH
jgi:hypothetical protein